MSAFNYFFGLKYLSCSASLEKFAQTVFLENQTKLSSSAGRALSFHSLNSPLKYFCRELKVCELRPALISRDQLGLQNLLQTQNKKSQWSMHTCIAKPKTTVFHGMMKNINTVISSVGKSKLLGIDFQIVLKKKTLWRAFGQAQIIHEKTTSDKPDPTYWQTATATHTLTCRHNPHIEENCRQKFLLWRQAHLPRSPDFLQFHTALIVWLFLSCDMRHWI